MPAVYVIYSPEDRAFVEKRLICPLPALGFDRWISRQMSPMADGPLSSQSAMTRSAAILVVVPSTATVQKEFSADVEIALSCPVPVVPVYLGARNTSPLHPVLTSLQKLCSIDAKAAKEQSDPDELSNLLARLLPPPGVEVLRGGAEPDFAAPIGWNEELFSTLLAAAVGGHDYHRSDALIAALSRHLVDGAYPYGDQHANTDLATLRKKRQFLLMRRYASAVVDSGTIDFKVRRQYAQALIELKDFDAAMSVLTPLIEETTRAAHAERFEARGLLGRLLKQRYIDAAERGNRKLLTQAIDAYWSVFREDQENVWHGINAASCILRARRDGIATASPKQARLIATKILTVLGRRQRKSKTKRLDVWDYATRVEALVALGEFTKASNALDEYLVHPDIDAFEVSSTYRQFDELLQLGTSKQGRPLVDRIARSAVRLRSGSLSHIDSQGTKPLLVRVSDPDWAPTDIPDLVIRSRLGPIVSVIGSNTTVRALLKDPRVISLDESRPSGQTECARSVPLVRVTFDNKYEGVSGSFTERGGSALVAIIDNGIDVLHEAFLDANGKSRIIGIWDQQDPDKSSPPQGFDFGRYHSEADIAGYVAQKTAPASLSRPNDGHGTHVASIAAGRKVEAGGFGGGVAPDARLLIVITAGDEPTGYSHTHVAALAFIKQTAAALNKPVVVNVSQGMNAGAHDGRSVLELSFDAFSNRGTLPGHVVVKSAGNERATRGHAKLTVPAKGVEKLIWRCPPGPGTEVNLELWWPSTSEYRFQLRAPSGDLSQWVDEKNPDVDGYFKKRGQYELKLVKRHPSNADSLLKIKASNGVSPIAASDWTLNVQAVRIVKKGDIHAWLERNNQTKVEFVNHDNEEMTLSVPGTSDSVITVSAINPDATINGEFVVEVGDFSSYGPTRDGREKPDVAAPGVKIAAARRGSTNGVVALCGTSMAAPHVTGAIALLLSKFANAGRECPTATQISSVLREKTINANGDWDRGSGYGVLDVAALLTAF